MRKFFNVFIVVMIIGFLFTVGAAIAGPPESPPESGKVVASEADMDAPAFKVSVENSEGMVKFLFPVRPDQDNLADDLNVQVYASYAYAKNGQWVLAEQDNFVVETGELKSEQVPASINFPDQGTGWFWVRTWAKDKASGNWIWVDESSDYCREDKEDRPGYEFLVNPETGETQPVPEDYETRD